jgi:amidase
MRMPAHPGADAVAVSTLETLSATQMAAKIASGAGTCEQLVRACIERIAAREPVMKAWSYLDSDRVLAEARRLDQRKDHGPLHGVPVGVKDIIDTCDMPTEMGSPIYKGYRPAADASCVALLRAAGAVILGKTVTCEFAGATPAATTNPYDVRRTPGGSSSGSAAAVADFMVPLALGTQTGGSVLRPASYCGIVGYKPTFGLINTAGVKPAAVSLDTVGLMARTVQDIELAMRPLTNSAPVAWLPPDAQIRLGVCRYAWDFAQGETRHAVDDAASRLASQGIAVRDVVLPSLYDRLPESREVVNDYERARGMAYEWQHHRAEISKGLANTIERGLTISRERYIDANRYLEQCRDKFSELIADFDVLLAPAVAGEAPMGLASTGDHRFQSIWTQLRVPAVTLPTHAGPNGMPVGIQLVAGAYGDSQLLAATELIFRKLGRGPAVGIAGPAAARV